MLKLIRHYPQEMSYFHFCLACFVNKRLRIPKGQSKMDNPEKVATWGTTHEEKQSKYTTQYVLDAAMRKQTHTCIT
jgi:hypothetical protein